jgi:mannose/cellobiose epimerase-like protein (N-acyl-D-glucosamine 2-epimerase family)
MMGKDGRYYWPISEQNQTAQMLAQRKGGTQSELQKIKARILHRWRGK